MLKLSYSDESANLEELAMETLSHWNNCREQLIAFSTNYSKISH